MTKMTPEPLPVERLAVNRRVLHVVGGATVARHNELKRLVVPPV